MYWLSITDGQTDRHTDQSTVDGDSLSGSLSSGSSSFQPLRTGQVNEMELGHQRLELGLSDGVGVLAVQRLTLSSSVLLMGPRVETEVNVPT